MAFIKEKERNKQVKKINQKYGFRKFLVLVEILGLIAFIVVVILNSLGYLKDGTPLPYVKDGKLLPFGWIMTAAASVLIILGVISVVFIFTFQDPYKVKGRIAKLESSAISGKKINKEESASKQVKDRVRKTK